MKRPVIALFAGIVLIAGVLLYPAISNPYLFVCGDGTCRYNLKAVEAFYRLKFGWRVKLSERCS